MSTQISDILFRTVALVLCSWCHRRWR